MQMNFSLIFKKQIYLTQRVPITSMHGKYEMYFIVNMHCLHVGICRKLHPWESPIHLPRSCAGTIENPSPVWYQRPYDTARHGTSAVIDPRSTTACCLCRRNVRAVSIVANRNEVSLAKLHTYVDVTFCARSEMTCFVSSLTNLYGCIISLWCIFNYI